MCVSFDDYNQHHVFCKCGALGPSVSGSWEDRHNSEAEAARLWNQRQCRAASNGLHDDLTRYRYKVCGIMNKLMADGEGVTAELYRMIIDDLDEILDGHG